MIRAVEVRTGLLHPCNRQHLTCHAAGGLQIRGWNAVGLLLDDGRDKAKPLARNRADQSLVVAAVANRVADRVQGRADRRYRDEAAFPDRHAQILLAHHPFAIADQIGQQLENARLDGHDLAAPPQLVPGLIEHIVFEQKAQLRLNTSAQARESPFS